MSHPESRSAGSQRVSGDSPAPRRVLRGALTDRDAGGGEERRAVLTVAETAAGVQHARLAHSARQTADRTHVSCNIHEQNQTF